MNAFQGLKAERQSREKRERDIWAFGFACVLGRGSSRHPEWTEVALETPGAQKFERSLNGSRSFSGFGGWDFAHLEKRDLHVSEARQRIMGEWEGDKRTSLEVERGGARGVQERDQRGRKTWL